MESGSTTLRRRLKRQSRRSCLRPVWPKSISLCDDRPVARGDLTDTQWERLAPLLPGGTKLGRPPIWTRRQLIDGIRFRTRTGVPWRDVPERYGPWGRVYDLFRRWQRDGTWQNILAELQVRADAKELITWDINVDSTGDQPTVAHGPDRPASTARSGHSDH
ncbi:transposase [Streptomyces sp. AK08-01B]|uniref:transposase n=1 Tax=unclassified Streptomyces TaxID=2593676 RepID=UPI0039F46457